MRGLAVPFIVRRMGASRLLLGCILLTTAITAALITALTSFWVQALGQAADGQLARSGAMSIVISGQVNARIAAAGGRAVRATMHTVFGRIPYQLDAARWSDPLGFTAPGQGGATSAAAPENGRAIRLAEAAALGQVRAHAVLVSGAWPGPPARRAPIPAALPTAVASQLRVSPGTVLVLRDRVTHRSVRLRVTGLFRPRNPRALYWGLNLLGTSGISVQPPS